MWHKYDVHNRHILSVIYAYIHIIELICACCVHHTCATCVRYHIFAHMRVEGHLSSPTVLLEPSYDV